MKNKGKKIDNGKVSIIVPFYKSEAFVKQCVESILNQSYDNIELILVDDGSPDKSGEISDDYAKKESRVKVIHQKNKGVCEARNAGMNMATGDYLMFVDGDDWLEKDCVEYLMRILKENNAEMSMSDCVFSTRNMTQNQTDSIRLITPEDAVCEIIYAKTPVGPWNKLYSMSVVKKHNIDFSVKWFGEGLYFSTMNAQYSKSIAYGHRKVYGYRKNNPNSGTTVRSVQNGINALDNIKNIEKKLVVRTKKTKNAVKWHIWKNNFNLIAYIVGANAKEEYLKQFKDAKKYLRSHFVSVLMNSDVGLKGKLEIIGLSLFPVPAARCARTLRSRMFEKDVKRSMKR